MQYGSPQLTRQALTTLQPFAASQLRDQPRSAISIQSAYADAAIRAQQGQQIFTGDVVPSTQTTDGVIVALCDTKVFNKLLLRVNAVRLEAVCQCKNRPVNGLKTKQCEQGETSSCQHHLALLLAIFCLHRAEAPVVAMAVGQITSFENVCCCSSEFQQTPRACQIGRLTVSV